MVVVVDRHKCYFGPRFSEINSFPAVGFRLLIYAEIDMYDDKHNRMLT